jgi:hypothetical protein
MGGGPDLQRAGFCAVQILNGEYDHLIGQYKDSEKP